MHGKKMWKVIVPIEKKDGSGTHWIRNGTAFSNKDESINVYLDTLPKDGKLQLREFTEEELRERDQRRSSGGAPRTSLANLPAVTAPNPGVTGSLPF